MAWQGGQSTTIKQTPVNQVFEIAKIADVGVWSGLV
jgi:hypothetical protein